MSQIQHVEVFTKWWYTSGMEWITVGPEYAGLI